jgi:folate-dependent phosphoribosylglycinamide formyltransferase PurN
MRSFAIYCSGNASTIRQFYSLNDNINKYPPTKIIYDGTNQIVLNKLYLLFGEDTTSYFDINKLTEKDKRKINTVTTNFIYNVMIDNHVEYLLCFGTRIIKKKMLNAFHNKIINFHPSLLSAFAGLNISF